MPRKTFTFDGKRYDITAATQEELIAKVALKKRDLEEGKVKLTGNATVTQWAEQWMDAYKQGVVGDSQLDFIRMAFKKNILTHIGNVSMRTVKPLHIQKLLMACTHLSNGYIKKIYYILHGLFETAVENKLILSNPATGVKIPRGLEDGHRRALTPYEKEHFILAGKTYQGGPFFLCSLYCGLRPGEAAALQWRHINFEKATLRVEQAVKAEGVMGTPKSKSGVRTIPIPEDYLSILQAIKPEKTDPYAYVFTQLCGARHTKTSIRRMWISYTNAVNISMGCKTFKRAIVPPYRLDTAISHYYLRHTYCTDLQAAGVPINVARELMGHSSIEMTAKIYTHSSDESFNAAADAINALHKKD